jgi:hypothetical protein
MIAQFVPRNEHAGPSEGSCLWYMIYTGDSSLSQKRCCAIEYTRHHIKRKKRSTGFYRQVLIELFCFFDGIVLFCV